MMSLGYGLGMLAIGMAVILIGGLIIYKIINTREENNDD